MSRHSGCPASRGWSSWSLSFFAWMLSRIRHRPPPCRGPLAPFEMTAADRRSLCGRHAVGLAAILVAYLLTTILRSIRADFAAELWQGLEAIPPRRSCSASPRC